MVALTQDRKTPQRSGDMREPPVKGGTLIYAGAMVALNGLGFAVPASASPALKVLGRAERRVDNTQGADGDQRVSVGAGIYQFDNSTGADLITRVDIGSQAYAVDDQTVAKTSGSNTRSVAGTIFSVDDLGVWVKFS